MQAKTIREIENEYELELGRILKEIKKQKAKIVLLQFPDGMKPNATTIAEELEKRAPKAEFLIWLGSCFGACDVPLELKELNIDLLIQFGHNDFGYEHLWR